MCNLSTLALEFGKEGGSHAISTPGTPSDAVSRHTAVLQAGCCCIQEAIGGRIVCLARVANCC